MVENLLQIFNSQVFGSYEEMINDGEKESCVVCKVQFAVDARKQQSDMIMQLQECKPPAQHLIHAVCFAKDLASLKVLGPECPVCQLEPIVTIHDTDCQDTVDFGG